MILRSRKTLQLTMIMHLKVQDRAAIYLTYLFILFGTLFLSFISNQSLQKSLLKVDLEFRK